MYLKPPSPRGVPYNLTTLTPDYDPSTRLGIETEELLLNNKVRIVIHLLFSLHSLNIVLQKEGFFVECGAFDGFFLANTLDLEVKHGWTGLLIEASPATYQILLTRKRKAMTSNVCLSLAPYPTEVCTILRK